MTPPGLTAEAALDRPQLVAALQLQAERLELLDQLLVGVVREPLGDRRRALRTDALDLQDLLLRGGRERVRVLGD